MYTNLEILNIFRNCSSEEELYAICNSFEWLIENKFMNRTHLVVRLAYWKYREIYN